MFSVFIRPPCCQPDRLVRHIKVTRSISTLNLGWRKRAMDRGPSDVFAMDFLTMVDIDFSLFYPGFRLTHTGSCECFFHCCIQLISISCFSITKHLKIVIVVPLRAKVQRRGQYGVQRPSKMTWYVSNVLTISTTFDSFLVQIDDPRTPSVGSYPSPNVH